MAKAPDALSALRSVEQLSTLSRDDLKRVAAKGTALHLPKDWTLMSESTPADKAYVIIAGQVVVRRHGEQIATVGPGGIIGEVGIVEKRLRTASVVSTTELQVVHFTSEDLAGLVEAVPAFGAALQATSAGHPADS